MEQGLPLSYPLYMPKFLFLFMEKRSRNEILWMAILVTLIVAVIDYTTGYEISLSVLYFGPVGFTAWYVGKRHGITIALLASLAWLNADLGAGHIYSHWSIPFWNAAVRFSFLTLNALLLGAFHKQLEAAKTLAHIDSLTGLLNVRAFDKELNQMISKPENSIPFTVAYIDLDNFKNINDGYGHLEGDRLLCAIGKTLVTSSRARDTSARVGGDEFALLLPKTNLLEAKGILEKLRQRLAKINIQGTRITCSIGAIIFTHPPITSSEAVRLADNLMYAAKKEGKNAVYISVYDESENSQKPLEYQSSL
jgi:diguanylate cyclase (GGDEF)-like protein